MRKSKNRPTRETFAANCHKLYSDLAGQIEGGELGFGAALPAETEFCQRYSLSRESVRKVMAQLILNGLVTRVPRKGLFAGQFAPQRRRENAVGVILPKASNESERLDAMAEIETARNRYPWMAELIEERFLEAGKKVELFWPEQLLADETAGLETIAQKLRGVVVIRNQSPEILRLAGRLAGRDTGVVFIPSYLNLPEGLSSVTYDNHKVGRLAARHLLELGHRRLACLSYAVEPDNWLWLWANQRAEGFATECAAAGGKCRTATLPIIPGATRQMQVDQACQAAAALLAGKKFEAIFGINDTVAQGVHAAAGQCGLRVPEDLSVIGCDNDHGFAWTGLTTISLEWRRAAEKAVDLVLNYLESREVRVWPIRLKIQPRLILRESTAPRA